MITKFAKTLAAPALVFGWALLLAGCLSSTPPAVVAIDNALSRIAKDVPAACLVVQTAEGYFDDVKLLVPAPAVLAESVAEAAVSVICKNPPSDVSGAITTLMNEWTIIQAATKVPPPVAK
jgi:hypothetical protein